MTKEEALTRIKEFGLSSTYYFVDKRGTAGDAIFTGTEAREIILEDLEWDDDGIVLESYLPRGTEGEEVMTAHTNLHEIIKLTERADEENKKLYAFLEESSKRLAEKDVKEELAKRKIITARDLVVFSSGDHALDIANSLNEALFLLTEAMDS